MGDNPSHSRPLDPIMRQQLDAARAIEEEALEGFQHLVDRWCERRHRMLEAYARFGESTMAARGPQDMMQAWLDLSQGVAERLAEDSRDQLEVGAALARNLARGPASLIGLATEAGRIARGSAEGNPASHARKGTRH